MDREVQRDRDLGMPEAFTGDLGMDAWLSSEWRGRGACRRQSAVNLLAFDLNQAERLQYVSKSGCTLW